MHISQLSFICIYYQLVISKVRQRKINLKYHNFMFLQEHSGEGCQLSVCRQPIVVGNTLLSVHNGIMLSCFRRAYGGDAERWRPFAGISHLQIATSARVTLPFLPQCFVAHGRHMKTRSRYYRPSYTGSFLLK
jgi:hypothetical protein